MCKSVHPPITGKVWLDRNLGVSKVAGSRGDKASYSELYQWGCSLSTRREILSRYQRNSLIP
ncbi:hypothetical protein BPUTSESOX_351 [uncultured Gammaproteobacteria bacterium]|nr:hypothetical protein BPUTSESOX_351 [uncultured Gammaproteobacteria bacterium]